MHDINHSAHIQTVRDTFSIEPYLPAWRPSVRKWTTRALDRALGLAELTRRYHQMPTATEPQQFADLTLAELGVKAHFDPDDLAQIPTTGGCLVIANHPHGGIDGVLLMHILLQVRPDVRFIANHFLSKFAELRPLFLNVNPFGGSTAINYNRASARAALSWLKSGGMLVMFPGGEVSSLDWRERRIVDPKWDIGVARLAFNTGVSVVPTFINGRNSTLFQIGGLIHPRIRTALLPREMLHPHDKVVQVRFGTPITAEVLHELPNHQQALRYLRTKTYLLDSRTTQGFELGRVDSPRRPEETLSDAVPVAHLKAELAALPVEQRILVSGNFEVWYAQSTRIPWLLQEIGRLREVSFRQVGEGTGKRSDIDVFDSYYTHLFVWDKNAEKIVGGYRLGHADEILKSFGPKGLYVHSLFKLDPALHAMLQRAIEVGRSFVVPEYQRSYSALLLLWRGVATYMALRPRYHILFGPVSISNDYHPISQQILVRYLQHHKLERARASLVRPRRPFRPKEHEAADLVDLDTGDLKLVTDLLGSVEHSDRGVPVLLRQYLKLGGQMLGFNIDPNFGNSIDCLLWVDMRRTELPLLRKYMGNELAAQFHTNHCQPDSMHESPRNAG